jgi:vacuolar protein sorting-associated protein 8
MHASLLLTPERISSPMGTPSKLSKPFLHPTISRLRSYPHQATHAPSSGSAVTRHSNLFDGTSATHLSEISRSSSPFNLNAASNPQNGTTQSDREVFRWTQLRNISHHIFAKASQKASAVLGSLAFGSPTVMAANGLVCIGTDSGRIFVFDFKQTLKCICGNESSGKSNPLVL